MRIFNYSEEGEKHRQSYRKQTIFQQPTGISVQQSVRGKEAQPKQKISRAYEKSKISF